VDFVLRGAALLAVVANATTLVRLRLEDLARQATAVARVRCLGARSFWEDREMWTETRFAVLEQSKGSLPAFIRVRMLGGSVDGLHSRVEEVPAFHAGEEAYVFLWAREGEPLRVLDGHKVPFALRATRGPERKRSPRIPPLLLSLIQPRGSFITRASAICPSRSFSAS
jgi:hypothetical protein